MNKNAHNIVTFGEIMMRLTTPGFQRINQTSQLDLYYGGGESNVAVSLANFRENAIFVTRLPTNPMADATVNELRKYGVNTQYIARGGDRMGIYFLEKGASQRPSKVVYDRTHTAISELQSGMIDWDKVFEKADWFHWTGITPALAPNVADCVKEACKEARDKGVKISCDLNYRVKLWTEEEAQKVMRPLMEYVDVCISNEEDAEKSLGYQAGSTDVEQADLDEEGYFSLARNLKKEYDFDTVAITLRESYSASVNGWSAVLHDNKDCQSPVRSTQYEIKIVDRVGGGDSFAAGLIYGLLNKENTEEALEFAAAASCLKHTIPGDANHISVDEVQSLAAGEASGRVQR